MFVMSHVFHSFHNGTGTKIGIKHPLSYNYAFQVLLLLYVKLILTCIHKDSTEQLQDSVSPPLTNENGKIKLETDKN